MEHLAQVPKNLPGSKDQDLITGIGPLGNFTPVDAARIFGSIISSIIGFLTVVAGLWFIFNIIIAGYGWLSAGGDKQKLADAQAKLTSSVIGLLVVVVAIFFVRFVTALLEIELVLDPVKVIERLQPK